MFKLINFLVKRPDLSLEQMKEHYESSHVPIALRTFPDILEHRRNYLPKDSAMAPPGVSLPEVDCIAELWFADRSGFERMMAIVMDPVAGQEVRDDGDKFLDGGKCWMQAVDDEVVTRR